ncbi:MAG: hypothetical protein R2741_09475 [Methanolobus sp.]
MILYATLMHYQQAGTAGFDQRKFPDEETSLMEDLLADQLVENY